MRRMVGMAAVMCALASFVPGLVHAQEAQSIYLTSHPDRWEVDAFIYGWLPTIDGKTNMPVGPGTGINITPQDIINNIKLGALGGMAVHKGNWGAFADLIYLDLGDHKQRDATINTPAGPVSGPVDLDFDVKSFVSTAAGTYTVLTTPELFIDLLAGARYLNMTQTLDLVSAAQGPLQGQGLHGQIKQDYWNGVAGARGRINVGPDLRWFIPFYIDLGTGDSAFTWQLMSGVGYRFAWGDVVANYRYMDFKGKSTDAVSDLSFQGPLLGVAFHW